MFFRRKSKKGAVAPPPVANPRADDLRVTVIEPVQVDIRQTLDVGESRGDLRSTSGFEEPLLGMEVELEDGGTPLFRPRYRPPMAVLKILDDNQKTGEMFRMRDNRVIIGRDKGDVVIAHDKLMSGRHAELLRLFEDEKYVWHLHDLQSRNGSFVKVDFMRLRAGDELMLGTATYVFEQSRQTSPRLLELASRHPRQVAFEQQDFLIGRDRDHCIAALADDILLEEQHARIQHAKGRWCVTALPSKNGVWARIEQVQLSNGTRFQLGEQRFQFLIP